MYLFRCEKTTGQCFRPGALYRQQVKAQRRFQCLPVLVSGAENFRYSEIYNSQHCLLRKAIRENTGMRFGCPSGFKIA